MCNKIRLRDGDSESIRENYGHCFMYVPPCFSSLRKIYERKDGEEGRVKSIWG